MLLASDENIVLGKLIALINGVTAEGDINSIKDITIEIVTAIKNKKNLSRYIDVLVELKKKLLPDCLLCSFPCGRTNDFLINSLPENKKDSKIKEYKKFIENLEDISFDSIAYNLSKLSW